DRGNALLMHKAHAADLTRRTEVLGHCGAGCEGEHYRVAQLDRGSRQNHPRWGCVGNIPLVPLREKGVVNAVSQRSEVRVRGQRSDVWGPLFYACGRNSYSSITAATLTLPSPVPSSTRTTRPLHCTR